MKAHKVYKGVKIFAEKIEIPGSSLRELKNGDMKECKPQFETVYRYNDSYPYDSVKECTEAIDRIWEKMKDTVDEKEFASLMNEG